MAAILTPAVDTARNLARQVRPPPRPLALRPARGPSRLPILWLFSETPWLHKVATSIVSAALLTTPLLQTLINTAPRQIPGHRSLLFSNRAAGLAPQATAPTFTCWAAWTKTLRRQPRFGATTQSAILITRACRLTPSPPTSTPLRTLTARSIASQAGPSAPIFTSRFTILPQIPGPWLQTTRLPTIASWRRLWAATFTPAAVTPPPTKPIATIQAPTPGTTLRSPICLRVARRLPPVRTMADGYLRAATLTSPSAPARSPGTPLPTPGVTWRIWCRLAITWEGQPQANPSTPSPAAPLPAVLPMTTSNTPKSALQRHQHRQRQQHPRLQRRLRQQRHSLRRQHLQRPRRRPLRQQQQLHLHLLLLLPPLPHPHRPRRRPQQLHLLRHRDLHRRRDRR